MNVTRSAQDNQQIYQLTVAGRLNDKWITWLDNMVIEIQSHKDHENTVIKVAIPDQAALRGILNKLWDLNLTLITVNQLQDKNEGASNERQ